MIRVTGDMHGEQARFVYDRSEKTWESDDYIIITGDFGFLFRDDYSENCFLDDLEQRPYTICFVDGNHENFPAICRHPVENWKGGQVHWVRNNIVHLMRGQVFMIENKKIFTMGGAYSIDRHFRRLNYSYWEEVPNEEEYKEAIRNLKQHNNEVDYILTHTAPKEIILRMGYTPNPHDLELTGFLEYLMYEIKYKHWYFGHWHLDKRIAQNFTAMWYDTHCIF